MATTAQLLIAYHRELKTGGLPDDLVNDMVRDAANTIVVAEGLEVATESLSSDSPTPEHTEAGSPARFAE